MVAVAEQMSEEGEENNVRWLLNLAQQLAEMLGLSGVQKPGFLPTRFLRTIYAYYPYKFVSPVVSEITIIFG
jgi:hypothetical protein